MTFAARVPWNSGAAAPPPPPPPPPAEAWLIDYDLALSNTVNIEFVGATNTTIEWGDGTIETFASSGVKSHTYVAVSGTVSVAIYGTCDALYLIDGFTAITSWDVGLTTSVLLTSADLVSLPDSLPTDITWLRLPGCNTFNDVNVATWNTSNLTDMESMFEDCTVFNQNISGWDTSSVQFLAYTFKNASAFNQPIGTWVTTALTYMVSTFAGATVFNANISSWNTSGVTNMNSTFNYAPAFNQDISAWSTDLVDNMDLMFNSASTFDQDISGWCVPLIPSLPTNFNTGGVLTPAYFPVWGTCPAPFLLSAPFTSATTTTDVISPPLTPTVTIPVDTTLTFDAINGTFNTFNNTGTYPSVRYGDTGAITKISPASYPAASLVFSAYIELAGYDGVTVSATAAYTELIRLQYQGYGGFWEITYGILVVNGVFSSYQIAPNIPLASPFETTNDPPLGGVQKYSIEWMPDGMVVWRLDANIIRVTPNSTRPITDFGCIIETRAGGYSVATGGVWSYRLRDFAYQQLPPTTVYTFINTSNNYVFTDSCRTFSYPSFYFANNTTTVVLTGKVYCEFACTAAATLYMYQAFGVHPYPPNNFVGGANSGFIYSRFSDGDAGTTLNGTGTVNASYLFAVGDIIGVAFDAATKEIWFSINGVFVVGNPAAGTTPSVTLTGVGPYYFQTSSYDGGGVPPGGTYTHAMYPSAATLTYSPPSGFTAYDPN